MTFASIFCVFLYPTLCHLDMFRASNATVSLQIANLLIGLFESLVCYAINQILFLLNGTF